MRNSEYFKPGIGYSYPGGVQNKICHDLSFKMCMVQILNWILEILKALTIRDGPVISETNSCGSEGLIANILSLASATATPQGCKRECAMISHLKCAWFKF